MIRKLDGAKTTTFVHDDEIFFVNENILGTLKRAARKDPLGRSRLCLHRKQSDSVQEMIVTLRKGFYVRPHRHVGKTESFHIIEGSILIVFFDDKGNVTRTLKMAHLGDKKPYIYRLSSEAWHTALPISDFVIFHEIISGPYDRKSSGFPSWAPEETDPAAIKKYLLVLTSKLKNKLR